jgi:hypothetical protein
MRLNTFGKQILAALVVVGALIGGTGVAHAAGTRFSTTRVEANATDSYRVWVKAGDTVTIRVEGDGDTDLDLFVYDSNGLVASDTRYGDSCFVRINVYSSGFIEIRVKNLGNVWNGYTIAVS